jgi:SAM-dependent methyltransferase
MIQAHAWKRRFAGTNRPLRTDPDEALVELVEAMVPARALDLGAGEGRNALWLARQGWQVTAVDLSRVALDRLSAHAEEEGLRVETVVADIDSFLALGERFDLVVMAYMHPSPERRPALLEAIARAVAEGGHLFFIGHHVSSLGEAGPLDLERLLTEEQLRDAFPGLVTLRLENRVRRRDGDGAALTDVVAWSTRDGARRP